jgi:hypothetical protein
MAKQGSAHRVPGRTEPDPENIRQRSFQGGDDGLTSPATMELDYGDMRYKDGDGPYAEFTAHGAGSGISGTAQADTGATPAMFSEPDLRYGK